MIKIKNSNYRSGCIVGKNKLIQFIRKLKKDKKIIGICDGSFDLLHPGHITHLNSAKKVCDVLIVLVARDKMSKERKGTNRPLFSEKVRAFSVSQIKSVDFVVLNNNTFDVLKIVKPDYYIKGPDYKNKNEKDHKKVIKFMEGFGGKVVYTEDQKLSTSEIITYIKKEVE